MELTLTEEEKQLLLSILEHRQREMVQEIAHTDHREFKEGLRRNEKTLETLVSHLRETAAQEVHS